MEGFDIKDSMLTIWHKQFDVAALSEALKVNQTLHTLSLGYNGVGEAGAAALSEALKVNQTLHTLSLYNNGVGDAGAAALSEALKVNQTLHTLSLGYNGVGDAGAAALSEALKRYNASLENLDAPMFPGKDEWLTRNKHGKGRARVSTIATYKVCRFRLCHARDICRLVSQYVAASRGQICWVHGL